MVDTRQQAKQLWQICFDDRPEFVDLYFKQRFRMEEHLDIRHTEHGMIAALQALPYRLRWAHTTVNMGYISGACTHPAHRGKGVMTRLLERSLEMMSGRGDVFSILIPAEPWLFGYYARMGYATVFHRRAVELPIAPPMATDTAVAIDASSTWTPALTAFAQEMGALRPCCVQHDLRDLPTVWADLRLSHGCCLLAHRSHRPCGWLMAVPLEGDAWQINELTAGDEAARQALLAAFVHRHRPTSLQSHEAVPATHRRATPYGMLRVLRPYEALTAYAQAHPHERLNLCLTDEQLPANNGHYLVEDGHCLRSEHPLQAKAEAVTPHRLATLLFAHDTPHMSLMLD
ncbi:MAG: GNAT family N-acetyltransferase [Bacteroides sp.]|nr:GNAT family N-acetyltransferase [Bacteroides sp.]